MTTLTVNGRAREIAAPDAMPLLWALRENLKLAQPTEAGAPCP